MAMRAAERLNLAALACGRNATISPPPVRYAFSPSKISCA